MTEQLTGVDEPRERLIEGMVSSLRNVRESPALSSWFATAQRPIGAEIAEQSQVIKALTEAFLISMAPDDAEVVERKARWLVRVMTSLLVFPGHDEADERAMIEEFVVPMVVPTQPEPTIVATAAPSRSGSVRRGRCSGRRPWRPRPDRSAPS